MRHVVRLANDDPLALATRGLRGRIVPLDAVYQVTDIVEWRKQATRDVIEEWFQDRRRRNTNKVLVLDEHLLALYHVILS